MAATGFGINGFGRIGRTAFRVWWQHYRDQVVLNMINTSGSMEIEDWITLLKYDSNYGPFADEIVVERQQGRKEASSADPVLGTLKLHADGKNYEIVVTAQREPAKIPWDKFDVTTVIESTGVFNDKESASAHLHDGVKSVIISAPTKGEGVEHSVIGVKDVEPKTGQIISNESCTTNCVAPVVAIIQQHFGIEKAMMTTIHAYTDDQNLHDNSHRDLRRARAASLNIWRCNSRIRSSVVAIEKTTETRSSLRKP